MGGREEGGKESKRMEEKKGEGAVLCSSRTIDARTEAGAWSRSWNRVRSRSRM